MSLSHYVLYEVSALLAGHSLCLEEKPHLNKVSMFVK